MRKLDHISLDNNKNYLEEFLAYINLICYVMWLDPIQFSESAHPMIYIKKKIGKGATLSLCAALIRTQPTPLLKIRNFELRETSMHFVSKLLEILIVEESSSFIWCLTTDYSLKKVKIYRHSNNLIEPSILTHILTSIIQISMRVFFIMRYCKFLIRAL